MAVLDNSNRKRIRSVDVVQNFLPAQLMTKRIQLAACRGVDSKNRKFVWQHFLAAQKMIHEHEVLAGKRETLLSSFHPEMVNLVQRWLILCLDSAAFLLSLLYAAPAMLLLPATSTYVFARITSVLCITRVQQIFTSKMQ